MGHPVRKEQVTALRCSANRLVVQELDPLEDPRWRELADRHPRASVFHTVAWLEALKRTYGYGPLAYTTSPAGQALRDGWVFCLVDSWLTGRRLVSLPFSDHCEPLIDDVAGLAALYSALDDVLLREKLQYIEMRPKGALEPDTRLFSSAYSYCFHQLDLRPDLDTLFKALHKDSIQRKIRRAEREGLVCEIGRSEPMLDHFWGLFLKTRRRHQSPPPPRRWFRNIFDCFGAAAELRVAFYQKQPVAAIVTLRHKETVVYKYGCSDARFNHLGGMPFLFWNSIEAARRDGLRIYDFGRSDHDNAGLITFKNRWGTTRTELTYRRITASRRAYAQPALNWKARFVNGLLSHLPDTLLSSVGSLVYRHIG